MSLKGKTIFITGASRGIGLAIAKRCAADGANIVIAAKTTEPLPPRVSMIFSSELRAVFCDSTNTVNASFASNDDRRLRNRAADADVAHAALRKASCWSSQCVTSGQSVFSLCGLKNPKWPMRFMLWACGSITR